MKHKKYALHRLQALFIKEFRQMLRDKLIFVSMIIFPLVELVIIGFIANVNPHNLPTAVVFGENSKFSNQFIQALKNTTYFKVTHYTSEIEAEKLLKSGDVQFIINIPPNFTHDLIRNNKPDLLLSVDASNPLTTTAASGAVGQLKELAFVNDFKGSLTYLQAPSPTFNLILHQRYNPDSIALYYYVPGTLCALLCITFAFLTANSIVKELNEGTLENLLTSPARPLEVILSKVIPYILLGYVQIFLVVMLAVVFFHIPFQGNFLFFLLVSLPLIISSLILGVIFSSMGTSEFNAIQYLNYYAAISLLFSGFIFPFNGMPVWAQWIGNCLPLTHYIRIVLGIMLKGNGLYDSWDQIWPILLFTIVVIFIAINRYKRTLD